VKSILGEILVAVDGSKYSDSIVNYACDLAKKLRDNIALIYVSRDLDFVNEYIEYGGRAPKSSAQRTVAIAESLTSELARKIRAVGIANEVILESGNPADKIVAVASYRKSDMILVGLKGLHGVEKIRSLGSVSRRVLENSPCPVVIVTRE
jgi:nucleotide-binding universal stress UspA family protein